MAQKTKFSPPAVGGSSLLTIFAVLCLSVFALLSVSTVRAEKRLADASLQAITDYYAADTQAETIFARLRSGEFVPGVEVRDDIYSYSCPISPSQSLMVVLKAAEGEWEILRWQAMVTEQPEINQTLPVWEGRS